MQCDEMGLVSARAEMDLRWLRQLLAETCAAGAAMSKYPWKPKPRSTWTEERRANHAAAVLRWNQQHPEKMRIIWRRSRYVYNLTKQGVEREEARQQARKRFPMPEELL